MIDKKPNAVLFDWDETIVATREVMLEAMNKTLLSLNEKPITELSSGPRVDNLKRLFGDKWKLAEKIYKDNLNLEVLDKISVNHGIIPLLQYLKSNSIYTAVVSNKVGDLLRKEADHLKLTSYFDIIIGSGDTPVDKPSPVPLLAALTPKKITPDKKVFYIGDGLVDMECAKAAGVQAVLYNNLDIKDSYKEAFYISTFTELLNYMV